MDNKLENLKLPAIRGIIGDWVYYQTVLPFKSVAELIDNDHDIREYKSLDDVLQRDLSKRAKSIKEYLLREQSRFFNSAIIGLYGETPNWYKFDFAPSIIPEMALSEEILNTIGILEFNGGEKLFSIDGQHRIDGIKQALKNDENEILKYDELPIILIAHNDTKLGKRRTRRLFSEINTKAVRVSGLDDLITNEDNPIDINARKLFADFELFEQKKYIALNQKANIDPNAPEFTTILNLREVNKVLYSKVYKHLNYRPSDDVIDKLYKISHQFWFDAFNNIDEYKSVFIDKTQKINNYINSDGGNLLFRPIGINIIAEATISWLDERKTIDGFWDSFALIDKNLDGIHWKDILWDNAKKVIKKSSSKFQKEYTKYLLNLSHDSKYVYTEYNKLKGIERREDFIELPPIRIK